MSRGFSLVELSIVLVILGLLVGGVLTGQSLIRAAELRSVTTEFEKYQAAVYTFRDKYFALPGDMPNATKFWGAAASCGPQDASTDGTTCNGDGSGIINPNREMYSFWQHLANAGLIDGSYNGASGPGNPQWDVLIGTNVPASKLTNGGWSVVSIVYDVGFGSAPALHGDISANFEYTLNQLHFGAKSPNHWTKDPILTPGELWNIDAKIDDGNPGAGRVIASQYNGCTTATNNDIATIVASNYALSSGTKSCAIIFILGL